MVKPHINWWGTPISGWEQSVDLTINYTLPQYTRIDIQVCQISPIPEGGGGA